jgi:hypothetical protein
MKYNTGEFYKNLSNLKSLQTPARAEKCGTVTDRQLNSTRRSVQSEDCSGKNTHMNVKQRCLAARDSLEKQKKPTKHTTVGHCCFDTDSAEGRTDA